MLKTIMLRDKESMMDSSLTDPVNHFWELNSRSSPLQNNFVKKQRFYCLSERYVALVVVGHKNLVLCRIG